MLRLVCSFVPFNIFSLNHHYPYIFISGKNDLYTITVRCSCQQMNIKDFVAVNWESVWISLVKSYSGER